MAESILTRIATEILNKLGSAAVREIGLACGASNELRKLKDTVSTINAVILDAEEQQETNREVKNWLEKLNDALYDADDLLDDFSAELLRREVMTQDKNAKTVRIFFSTSNQLAFSFKMGHKVKAIRERFQDIAQDRHSFHFTERSMRKNVGSRMREETHSFVPAEGVIGRDDDKREIVQTLLDSNVEENVSVVAIVGMGGLGKTALAQLVYNDETVNKHFESKKWVCVSDFFEVKHIATKIIGSKDKNRHLSMNEVQTGLRKEIDEKRYLLVLDDVWNESREKWLELKNNLMGGTKGSKILVTTRAQSVARACGVVSAHHLKGLSEEESWSLFKQMAFGQGKEPENPRMITIGKEIVNKCGGVPLAIRALGGLLYSRNTEKEWLNFKAKDMPKMGEEENVVIPILKLSYDNLPSNLKRCFAFCSIYPKDYKISKQQLIRLWMAHGLIQSSDGTQEMEETGDLYFMNLLRMSLFQDVEGDEWGEIQRCKMHDLIHDLAESVSGRESSQVYSDAKEVSPRIRHVFCLDLSGSLSWKIPIHLLPNNIRTLLVPSKVVMAYWKKSDFKTIVSSFKRLRALSQTSSQIKTVPSCIGKLKHLRYLDLSGCLDLKTLPSSITKLQNLQTLNLKFCDNLEELPSDMRKLINLRHLELDGCDSLIGMPHGLGRLTSLRTLTDFVGGRAGLSELKALNNLQGELRIRGLGRVRLKSTTNAGADWLKEKHYLRSLRLEFDAADDEKDLGSEVLLESLQPHPILKELTIKLYGGLSLPRWMMGSIGLSSLPNLIAIKISYCKRCTSLPRLGQLPFLEHLRLKALDGVEYMEDEYGRGVELGRVPTFFPSLKVLQLNSLCNLKGWWRSGAENPESLPSFPCVSESQIKNCPLLPSLPVHPSVERLDLRMVTEKLVIQQLTMPTFAAATSSSSIVPLSKLMYLRISQIDDLVTLPDEAFQNLTSLQIFKIVDCPMLASLSGGFRHLTSLNKLVIKDCPELDFSEAGDGMHFQGLVNLAFLEINGLPQLGSLPVVLQHATSLQSLEIVYLDNFKALPEWIGNLSSLQTLVISGCPNMVSLPDEMRSLTALRKLKIEDCAKELFARCWKETREALPMELAGRYWNEIGEDWPKIAHIIEVIVEPTESSDDEAMEK